MGARRQACRRCRTRATVTGDYGAPVAVAILRSFRMRAISRADLPSSSSKIGASVFARSSPASRLAIAKLISPNCFPRTQPRCPPYPHEPTSSARLVMAVKCQFRKSPDSFDHLVSAG